MARYLDKCLGPRLLKSAYVQMMWRMLVGHLVITQCLLCVEISVLEIISKKRQLCGHGNFQPKSKSN